MVLAGVSIADKFMAKNAQKKVETFTNNLNAEKARELNQLSLAQSFKTNELDALQKVNPGLDYTNANSWNLTIGANGKVQKAGSVYNALKKEYAENLRADYGIGTTGNVLANDLKRYREDVEKQTVQAYKALEAKYAKFKPSLGTTKDLIDSQYKQVIQEGSKQLLSARNTSSIRKLLSKFGVADDVEKSLEKVEMGGVDLYLSKELIANQTARKQSQADATARYEELIAKRGDAQIEVDNDPFRKGLTSTRAKARSTYSNIYRESDKYTFQVSGEGFGKAEDNEYGTSTQNPRLKKLDSIAFMHDDSQGQKQPLLSVIPTEGDATIMFSQIHNKLVEENRKKDLNEITLAYDLNIEKIAKARQEAAGIDDPSMIRLTEEDFARAKYDAVMDLVTISGDLKTIKVTPYSKFINQQSLVDNEIADERQDMVQEGNKVRPELLPNGQIRVTYSPTPVTKEILFNQFKDVLEKEMEDNQGINLDRILQDNLDKSFPIDLHSEVREIYNSITTPKQSESDPEYIMNPFTPISTVLRDSKKKMTTYKTDTNVANLVNFHLDRLKIVDKETAINNLYDIFIPAVIEIESSGNPTAKNPNSTARGLFQFLEGSVEPALNRAEKYLGTLSWGKELRVHKDASKLTPVQQTILFVGDMLEKTGSDSLMLRVFNGDIEGMIKAYEVLHHTAPDKATEDRAREIFNQYS